MQFCREQGCGELVPYGRCAQHQPVGAHRYRPNARAQGYSSRWDAHSRAFRQRYPLCGMRPGGVLPVLSRCYDTGRTTRAQCVDHVVPHRGDARLMWDDGNLQSLCGACHLRKIAAGL